MGESELQTELLEGLVAAVYAFLVVGLVVLRRKPRMSIGGGFRTLGEVLRARFPDLPDGFTLREGLVRARQVEPGLDWGAIDQALIAYEGYRYGTLPESGASSPVVVNLVTALRRSGR
jgi:hypothetical protein